jgi:hypothetical protein
VSSLKGSNPAAKGPPELRLLGTLKPCRAPTCGLLRGHGAGETPPQSGSMTAQPVTRVAAGYVNSGQHAIRGRLAPFFARSGGVSPITKRRFGGSPGLSRGSEAPLSYGSGQHSGVCGRLALLTSSTRSSGAGHGRYPPVKGRERSLATSTRGAHAARAGGQVPEAWRGGPPPGKLSGGNWIGRSGPCWRSRRVACGWGRFGAPLPSGSARLRLSLGGGAPTGPPWVPDSYLVDSASSHMLVSKIKPCMSKYKQLYRETANGSLNQLSFI